METSKIINQKIVILGSTCVGKTSIISQYIDGSFNLNECVTVVASNLTKTITKLSGTIKFNIWDTAGLSKFRSINTIFWKSANIAILVYDPFNKDTFDEVKWYIDKMQKMVFEDKIFIIICENKNDIIDRKKEITFKDVEDYSYHLGIQVCSVSAKTGQGIMELFDICANYAIDKNLKDMNIDYLHNTKGQHEVDLSKSELKHLISQLEKENNQTLLLEKIKAIENYLKDKKPMKCNFNYQKWFSLLFRRMETINNNEKKNKSIVNIYLQLLIIFPDITNFLNSLNTQYKIIELIHSMKDDVLKQKYYILYTNNYEQNSLNTLEVSDLIQLYNFHFFHFLNDIHQFYRFLGYFSKIIITLNVKIKEFTKNELENNKDTSYIIELMQSFLDIFIFFIVLILIDKHSSEVNLMENFVQTLFPIYFELQNKFHILDKALFYKIICAYCIIFSNFTNNINNPLFKHIITIIKCYPKVCNSILFEIMYSMNNNNCNLLINNFTKKIYLQYYSLTLGIDYKTLLSENTFLSNYDRYMNSAISSFDNVYLYQGYALLLINLFEIDKSNNTIDIFDNNKIPNFIVINSFLSITDKKNYNMCYKEILGFISVFLNNKDNELKQVEWSLLIRLMDVLLKEISEKQYYKECFDLFNSIINNISNHFNIFNYKIITEFIPFIKNCFIQKIDLKQNVLVKLYQLSLEAVRLDYYEFIDLFITYDSYFQYITLINLLKIMNSQKDNKIRKMSKIVLSNYRIIVYQLCSKYDKNDTLIKTLTSFCEKFCLYSSTNFEGIIDEVFDISHLHNYYNQDKKEKETIDYNISYFFDFLTIQFKSNNQKSKELLLNIIETQLKKICNFLSLYYNVFTYNDNQKEYVLNQINQVITELLQIKLKCNNTLQIINLFFMFKDKLQLSESSDLINYIYILLILSRRGDSHTLNDKLSKYITIQPIYITEDCDSPSQFYNHFSDIVCLYYISFLNKQQLGHNEQLFIENLFDYFSFMLQSDRDIIFELFLHSLLKNSEERINISIERFNANFDEYQIIPGNNNKIYCQTNNKIIEITPCSSLAYIISFELQETKETVIINDTAKINNIENLFINVNSSKNVNDSDTIVNKPETIIHDNNNSKILLETKEDYFNSIIKITKQFMIQNTKYKETLNLLKTLVNIPIFLTYHVNIFYYPIQYKELTLDNLLEPKIEHKISPKFYTFLSKLGNTYVNEKNEKVIMHKDLFYNISFDLVNLKRNREEKEDLIKNNCVNIIWLDNEAIALSNTESVFQSISKENSYTIITIGSSLHCTLFKSKKWKRHYVLIIEKIHYPLKI